jgi:hypothetical protein
MRSCWWAVSLRTSQSSPKAELPLPVSHDTRKGATVSTRSKLCQCSALEIPACSCALCSTRGSGHRDTQSVSPRLEHTARRMPQRATHADDAAPPSASGAEGREKRKCTAWHPPFAVSLPLPSCTRSHMCRPAPCAAPSPYHTVLSGGERTETRDPHVVHEREAGSHNDDDGRARVRWPGRIR